MMSSKRNPAESELPSGDDQRGDDGSAEPGQRVSVKRQRVSRACDQCRAAREKCDGIQPQCFPCVSQNRTCTYQANPKKRGVQTGYIRTLELALAWVFENVPGSEDALGSLLAHQGGQGRRLLMGKEPGAGNRLHHKWRRSRVHREIDHILSGDKSPRLPNAESASDTEGAAEGSSHLSGRPDSPSALPNIALDSPEDAHRKLSERTAATSPTLVPHPQALTPAPPGLKLPANYWQLMDIYFSYTHSWLPILQRQEMFQTCFRYSSENGLNLPSEDPFTRGIHAELWSALALASFQDAASSRPPMPANDNNSEAMTPAQIYNVARSLVPTETGPFQIHHTRALLLLSLVNLGAANFTAAWLLIGSAVRILLDVSSDESFAALRQEGRFNSVLIACFIMDTMVSQHCNRPPHLMAEDMVEAKHLSVDGLDEWQPWAACEGFGPESRPSGTSRNPACCLSTFNQLYDIFKVVSRNIAVRRARTELRPTEQVGVRQLQEAVNLHAPFGNYIVSPDLASAPVPSPYLLKIIYLSAMAFLEESVSEPTIRLLGGVIEQYRTVFGSCAMPPFIASCLTSIASHRGYESLPEQVKAPLSSLPASCSSIWNITGYSSRASIHPRLPQYSFPASPPILEAGLQTYPLVSPLTFPGTMTSPSYSAPRNYMTSAVITGRDTSSSSLYNAYSNPPGILSPAATVLTRGPMIDTDNTVAAQTAAVSLQGHYMPLNSGLGVAPTDYDALLDDLALIDHTDGLDVDPQFMVNLGFAPGCDLSEVFRHDFTAY